MMFHIISVFLFFILMVFFIILVSLVNDLTDKARAFLELAVQSSRSTEIYLESIAKSLSNVDRKYVCEKSNDILFAIKNDETAYVFMDHDRSSFRRYQCYGYYVIRDTEERHDKRRFATEDKAIEAARAAGFKHVVIRQLA